jgi:hypothetical protein
MSIQEFMANSAEYAETQAAAESQAISAGEKNVPLPADPEATAIGLPPETYNPIKWDLSPEVMSRYQYEDVSQESPMKYPPHFMIGKTDTPYGRDWNRAHKIMPGIANYWEPKVPYTADNSFGEQMWQSVQQNSMVSNAHRMLDQVSEGLARNTEDELKIYEQKDEILFGVDPKHHDYILTQPTYDLALREAGRVRQTQKWDMLSANTGAGTQALAGAAGFILNPTDWIPSIAVAKIGALGLNAAARIPYLAAQIAKPTSLVTKSLVFAAAGGFEEAVRMAPRWASDPTYQMNEYATNIALGTAFSGAMPAVFMGAKRGLGYIPEAHETMTYHLNQWGVDRAVRQALTFPGQLRDTGLGDIGTAVRRSKEIAQQQVDANWRDISVHSERRRARVATAEDLNSPSNRLDASEEVTRSNIDSIADGAMRRTRVGWTQTAMTGAVSVTATAVLGPGPAILLAGMVANRDPIALAMKAALIAGKNAPPATTRNNLYKIAAAASDSRLSKYILEKTQPLRGTEGTTEAFEEGAEWLSDRIAESTRRAQDRASEVYARRRSGC